MITVYFDGSCEPVNPGGTASYGFIVYENDKEFYREAKIVCSGNEASNNVAEYHGLLNALRCLYKFGKTKEKIIIYGDSNLVIQQMKGKWSINKGLYIFIAEKCKDSLKYFDNICFEWIPRDKNKADIISRPKHNYHEFTV